MSLQMQLTTLGRLSGKGLRLGVVVNPLSRLALPPARSPLERGPRGHHPWSSARRNRRAVAAASPSAYRVRGQKKPRSPSPLVRGTT